MEIVTDRKYKTGDMHPELNQTAFVEYDENGHEIWTSVYADKTAPYRLASLNALRRSVGTQTCARTSRTDTQTAYQQSNERQTQQSCAQLRKSLGR